MSKKDKNLVNPETVMEETETKANAEVAADGKEGKKVKEKKKKKQTYTVEELLAHSDEIVYEDEFHRKVKIKVKTNESKLRKREARMGYVFTAPWIVGALAFLTVPLILSFWMSFSFVRLNGFKFIWKGIENYQYVLKERALVPELVGFIVDIALAVPLVVVFALIMAMLLNMKLACRGLFRAIYFLPVIVVSGPVMSRMMNGSSAISTVDIEFVQIWMMRMLPEIIVDPIYNVFTGILTILWYSGVQILIFLAAIQKIDNSLYEAAKIDGGSGWECFWKITLPTIKPMILLNAIYSLIFISQQGNWFIDRLTAYFNRDSSYGRGAAMAWIFTLLVMVLVGIVALLFVPKADAYAKQVKKTKKLEKKTRKQIAKTHKRAMKNSKKFEAHVAKQEKLKAKKDMVEGGKDYE